MARSLASLLLFLSACSDPTTPTSDGGAPPDAPARPEPAGLAWEDCGAHRCAFLDVPIDHARPDGPTLSMRLVRIPARGEPRGTVVVNFGGPGVAGVSTLIEAYPALSAIAPEVRSFDVVSFDPRGIGESEALHCRDGAFFDTLRGLDFSPDDDAERAALDRMTDELAAGCLAAGGAELLGHLDTESVARDVDLLRAALGEEELSYLGISYGTWLGATYATLFPERVAAMVLDSPVAPGADRRERTELQAAGYEDALDRFLAWCGETEECAFHGGEGEAVATAFDALVLALDAAPVPAGRRSLGATDLFACLHDTLREGAGAWPVLGRALDEASRGDGSCALARADALFGRSEDGTYTSFLSALLSVSAVDLGFPPGYSRADFDAFVEEEIVLLAPRMGRYLAALDRFVVGWPVTAPPHQPLDGAAADRVLLVDGAHDPATPRDGALRLLAALEGARRLPVETDGHVQLLLSACAREAIMAFALDPSAALLAERCE